MLNNRRKLRFCLYIATGVPGKVDIGSVMSEIIEGDTDGLYLLILSMYFFLFIYFLRWSSFFFVFADYGIHKAIFSFHQKTVVSR